MYYYSYANAGFIDNATSSIRQYAPLLFIGGTGLFLAMMFGPAKFGNLGGGNLIPLLSIGMMVIGGYVIFSNAKGISPPPPPPPPKPSPPPHTKTPTSNKTHKAKYAYYY